MTTIERKIYRALEDQNEPLKLSLIADLYRQAFSASPRLYGKVQWDRLHAEIKQKCGQRGLSYVRRAALEQNLTQKEI